MFYSSHTEYVHTAFRDNFRRDGENISWAEKIQMIQRQLKPSNTFPFVPPLPREVDLHLEWLVN
jgi:hypothetical protein